MCFFVTAVIQPAALKKCLLSKIRMTILLLCSSHFEAVVLCTYGTYLENDAAKSIFTQLLRILYIIPISIIPLLQTQKVMMNICVPDFKMARSASNNLELNNRACVYNFPFFSRRLL